MVVVRRYETSPSGATPGRREFIQHRRSPGLKGFRGDVADELFSLQSVDRFAFDVELIYLALTYGLEIKRIPVMLETNSTSSVRLGRDAMRTVMEISSTPGRAELGQRGATKWRVTRVTQPCGRFRLLSVLKPSG